MNPYREKLDVVLKDVNKALWNPSRRHMISDAVEQKRCVVLPTGTLATWTPPHSTGRSPKDTYMVKNEESAHTIDWTSANCIPMEPDTFEMIFQDAVETFRTKSTIYALDRVVGADSSYALPVLTVTYNPLSALFIDNMFRAVPKDLSTSVFAEKPFLLVSVPWDMLDRDKYKGRLG